MRPVWFFCAAVFWGCGIEEIDTLTSPQPYFNQYLSNPITLKSLTINYQGATSPLYQSTLFRGFEIYYKFYVDDTDYSYISADFQNLTTNGNSYSRLESLGYQRLQIFEDAQSTYPIADIYSNLNDDLTITLDFNPLFDSSDKLTDAARPNLIIEKTTPTTFKTVFPAYRAAKDTNQKNLRFNALYDSSKNKDSQSDLSHLKPPFTAPKTLQIAFFVLAYGWDFDSTPRSIAVPWGVIKGLDLTASP